WEARGRRPLTLRLQILAPRRLNPFMRIAAGGSASHCKPPPRDGFGVWLWQARADDGAESAQTPCARGLLRRRQSRKSAESSRGQKAPRRARRRKDYTRWQATAP